MAALTFNIDDATLSGIAAASLRLKTAAQEEKNKRMAKIQQWIDGELVPAIRAAWGQDVVNPPKSITVYLDGVWTWEEVQKIPDCWLAKNLSNIWIETGEQLPDRREFKVHIQSR